MTPRITAYPLVDAMILEREPTRRRPSHGAPGRRSGVTSTGSRGALRPVAAGPRNKGENLG